LVWTDATDHRLFPRSAREKTVVPGLEEAVAAGLWPNPKDRADLIEFLPRATRTAERR